MKEERVRNGELGDNICSTFYSEKWTLVRKITKACVLMSALGYSSNSYGEVNTITCDEIDTLETYNAILEAQKNNLTPDVHFSLGYVAICIGKYAAGLKHMRSASEDGHVGATYVLGDYYAANQSFDSNQKASTENIYRAITYFEKTAEQIEATSSYPNGISKDMKNIEYVSMTSYRVFTSLPTLRFNIYTRMMGDIIKNGSSYSNTMETLQELGDAATRCLGRPALSAWKEKKELVYRTQQIECQAYLDFVRAIYPLEDERIQIANSCTTSVNQCEQHKEQIKRMTIVLRKLKQDLRQSPGFISVDQGSQ